jgi:Ca2+-binding RTX toxin-like protein
MWQEITFSGGLMSAAYTSTADFTIAENQGLQSTDQDGLWITQSGGGAPPNLTLLYGSSLTVAATLAYTGQAIYGVQAIGSFSGASFTMAAQSELNVLENDSPPYALGDLAGYGVFSTDSPNLTITAGRIWVGVSGQAVGVLAPFSRPDGFVTLQQGSVEVVSNDGAAYGVRMDTGGTLQITLGTIQATAQTVAYGVFINGDGGSVFNHGIITAGGEGSRGGYGVAVEWLSSSVAGTSGAFVNDGMLTGDYALVAKAAVVNPSAIQVFTNNGAMVGAVDLGEAPSHLLNNGRIDGQVAFGASNDLYDGHAGTVTGSVLAGGGDDTLIGGGEGEALTGAAGNDSIAGGVGADTIDGGAGSNVLFGGAGGDLVTGGAGYNRVNGNTGDDTLVGHSAVGDWLLGGQGQDSISAAAATGADIINGNLGDDTLVGGAGADMLPGGQGNDVIRAGSGADWISGDLGSNSLYGGQGADTFHAGAGHDAVNGWHVGDHVQVDAGVTWTVSQAGADTHVNFSNGGEMDLLGVQKSLLQAGWIAGGQ